MKYQENPTGKLEDTIENGKLRIEVNQTEGIVKTNYTQRSKCSFE